MLEVGVPLNIPATHLGQPWLPAQGHISGRVVGLGMGVLGRWAGSPCCLVGGELHLCSQLRVKGGVPFQACAQQ